MEPVGPSADVLFEISWEVCNKVGGIYTVIASKASLMRTYYKEYFCIGPYLEGSGYEFEERPVPERFRSVFESLARDGVVCRYGVWQIKGEPAAILVDASSLFLRKDEFKARLWERFGIDSLNCGWGFEEPIVWSYGCALLIERLKKEVFPDKKVVSHHHEWMAGISLLFLKDWGVDVRTVFTTHATMLGRSIAGHGEDLYGMLGSVDAQAKAYELGVQDKFLTERACAKECSVFTTVSEITALEAEKLLGRKADVLLFNGFDMELFPTIEETSIKHVTSRETLRELLCYHFFPYYHNFLLEHNLMVCISGRYEYHNKGMDVFVDALARLNGRLRGDPSPRTVTAFFFVPGDARGVRTELLENKNYYRHIKNYVQSHTPELIKKVIRDFITSEDPAQGKDLFTKEFMQTMKRDVLHFKRQGNPPLTTHYLADEHHDPLVQHLLHVGLDNRDDDRVKVVVVPAYLDGDDGFLNLPYYDVVAGTHLAVFPSYYEPWGYTPLEAAALGVPTLTTDLAGFGRFIKGKPLPEQPGIFVQERFGKSYEEAVQGLHEELLKFITLDHSQRVQNKINAKQLSKLADWEHMVKNYIAAHNLAIKGP